MEKIIFDKFTCSLHLGDVKKKIGSKDALVLEFLFLSGPEGAQKADLLRYAWQGLIVTDASLSKSISNLRAVLFELSPNNEIILTIPRVGYKVDESHIVLRSTPENNPTKTKEVLSSSDPQQKNKFKKYLNALSRGIKPAIIFVSVVLILISTKALFFSVGDSTSQIVSPSLSKVKLKNGSTALFSEGVDKIMLTKKMNEIDCNCLYFLYKNNSLNFIYIYSKDKKKALNFIYKKDDLVDIKDIFNREKNQSTNNYAH